MRLTEEQRALAEQHHGLIYVFLRQNHLSIDEYYDIAAIGFCKAMARHDSNRGFALSTFAFHCMRCQVQTQWCSNKRKKEIPQSAITSLYEKIPGSEWTCLTDIVADPHGFEEDIDTCIDYQNFLQGCNPYDLDILTSLRQGMRQRQIAIKKGCHQTNISYRLRCIRQKIRAERLF